jgi:hypothetical protein
MFRSRDRGPGLAAVMALPLESRLDVAGTDLLGWLGAVPFEQAGPIRYGECWVYGLYNAAGECFYVGKFDCGIRRLGNWQAEYKEYLAGIRVLRCRDAEDMIDTENFLIRRMQPARNTLGTDEELRRRQAKARNAPRPYGGPGRGTYDRDKARAWRRARGEEVAG